jgi:hypothetical protein
VTKNKIEDTPVTKKRKAFKKQLEKKPATAQELWLAIQLLSDDWIGRSDPMDPVLDYLESAREIINRIKNPGKFMPLDDVIRKYKLEQEE